MSEKNIIRNTVSQNAFWMLNKLLVKKIGFISALILSDLVQKESYFSEIKNIDTDKHGFFIDTDKTIVELCVDIKTYRKYRDVLIFKKLIYTEKRGMPRRVHYFVKHKNISLLLSYQLGKDSLTEQGSLPQLIGKDSLTEQGSLPQLIGKDSLTEQGSLPHDNNINISNINSINNTPPSTCKIPLRFEKNTFERKAGEVVKLWSQYFFKIKIKDLYSYRKLITSYELEHIINAIEFFYSSAWHMARPELHTIKFILQADKIANYNYRFELIVKKNTKKHSIKDPHNLERFSKNHVRLYGISDNYTQQHDKAMLDINYRNNFKKYQKYILENRLGEKLKKSI